MSEGGLGNPEAEVCHKTPSGSIPLIAVQKGGRAGGVTASNFSSKAVITSHGGGAGIAAAEISVWPQLSSSGEVDSCARWAIARKEPISPTTAMPAATKKSEQRTFRNRGRVNALFGFVITELLSRCFYPEVIKVVNIFRQRPTAHPQAFLRSNSASSLFPSAAGPLTPPLPDPLWVATREQPRSKNRPPSRQFAWLRRLNDTVPSG